MRHGKAWGALALGMGSRAISNEALVESLEAQAAPGRALEAGDKLLDESFSQ